MSSQTGARSYSTRPHEFPLAVWERGAWGRRIAIDDLIEAAREQGIGDLNELNYAVLEPDGRFSFVKRDGHDDHQEAKGHISAE